MYVYSTIGILVHCCIISLIVHALEQEDPSFLADSANILADTGHYQAALDVCSLFPSPPSPSPHPHIPLLTVQLETLGQLGRETDMEEVMERVSWNHGISTSYSKVDCVHQPPASMFLRKFQACGSGGVIAHEFS